MKFIEECQLILDIPCGRGFFLKNDLKRIIGVDINASGLREAKAVSSLVVQADGMFLPFRDTIFDGIHCAHLIEHMAPEELLHLLKELNRVLKKNGVIIIRSPILNKLFFNDPSHIKPYPPSAIMAILNMTKESDLTLYDPKFNFDFIDLSFRYRDLFQLTYEVAISPRRFFFHTILVGLGKLLGKFRIKHWEKEEYRLVIRKR